MRRLVVKNVGPIKHVDIELKKINVFIGSQGSGKSTLAKIISFCSWLEKRRGDETSYIDAHKRLVTYHRLDEYFSENSMILYHGENLIYAYGWPENEILHTLNGFNPLDSEPLHVNDKEIFFFSLSPGVNPKVAYIPAERNFVSVVPTLQDYTEGNDNLQGFVLDWFRAKDRFKESNPLQILNFGVRFSSSGSDHLILENGKTLRLSAAASGYQSVTPLVAMIDWLANGIYKEEKPFSPSEAKQISDILSGISEADSKTNVDELKRRLKAFVEGKAYSHTQFIIEEPCQNLFPNAQKDLIYYLISSLDHGKNHHLVMTTHSPYVLTSLNNLIYAHKVGQTHEEEVAKLINPSSWIAYRDINVLYVADGGIESIMDEEQGLIKAEMIDGISTILNEEFDKLLEIEVNDEIQR